MTMNVVFLGKSTEEKKFLLLCLAKIMSCREKVVLISKSPYITGDMTDTFEYCGIEIVRCRSHENPLSKVIEGACNFLDVDELVNVPENYTVVAVSEPARRILEGCAELTREYIWLRPSLSMILIFLNVMEYSRIDEKYLSMLWERYLPSFAKIERVYTIYFEYQNRSLMIESQFIDKLPLKRLSPGLKSALKAIIQDIFQLGKKEAGMLFRKAERV